MLNPLDHPICFSSPERLTQVASWHEHIPFAMLLVDLLRPEIIVELGTHLGDSYCAFCQAVKELNLDARCYAVDTWQGDSHAGLYGSDILENLRAHHDPAYGSFSSLIQSTFDDALKNFADGTINLLHIDGYHTYEAVKHDFESWLPKMSADGVVLFHDTNVRERDFGVCFFWDEVKQRYPHFEFLHGHGLGVLALGRVRSERFQALLESNAEETIRIRDFFFQLGHRLTLKVEAAKKQLLLGEKKDQLLRAETELRKLQARRGGDERGHNALQLFWHQGEEFSEKSSIKELMAADEQPHQYCLRLPLNARGPLRLDTGNRPAYVEITDAALYAGDADSNDKAELLAGWSAANDFAGLIPASGVIRLGGRGIYRFICVDDDPQLLLSGVPAREGDRPWFLRLSVRVSEQLPKIISEEIKKIEGERANTEARLLALSSRLEEEEKASRAIQARMAEREQAANDLKSHFLEELEAQEKTVQSLSDDLESARTELSAATESLTEKQKTIEALRVEFDAERGKLTRQIEEKEAAIEESHQTFANRFKEQGETVESLKAEMANQENALLNQLKDEQERSARQAQAVESLSTELRRKEGELHEKDYQLQRITRSLGWRLLSRYGRIKYRLLLPVFHWLRDLPEILFKHKYHPSIEPANEVLSDAAGNWISTGNDPQFSVKGAWPKGWTELSIDIEPDAPVTGNARLYVDRGAGYNEADSYDLGQASGERRRYVRLGQEVVALRLDPFESKGCFRINKLVLKRISGSKAARRNGGRENTQKGSTLKQFAQFSMERAESFRRKNGRSPRLTELPGAVRRTVRAWNRPQGTHEPLPAAATADSQAFETPQPLDPYDAWLEVNGWNARRESLLKERLSRIANPPLLSVVMPVYNPPPEFLDKAIKSVAGQVYQNWELCIADDASTDPAVKEMLERWRHLEPRVRVVFREKNGHISRATNSAAELARGDFIVLMDQDDEITPDALGEVALYLSEHAETDLLYSDDDKINAQGQRFAPQFKPDWSPELLLSYMYFSHLFVMKRSLYFDAGELRAGYEGSQDYDLALRATEMAGSVGHIPKVLYHWRVLPGSTALSGSAKPDSFRAGMKAVQDALDRREVRAKIHQPDWAAKANCGIFSPEFPDDGPRVAIIIPTKNNLAVLKACVESLRKTSYKNYEVIIIDNESDDAATLEYLRKSPHRVLRIASPGGKFSFAAINNAAVKQTAADCVLFLNNDTEVVTPYWLSQMVGYLGLQGVGAVGARLLFPDGSIQHAGIVHGLYNGMAGPAFKLLPGWNHGYMSHAMVARNYSAVTAACLLTHRDLFLSAGGFDEQDFAVAYNDVDYCYRIEALGHRIVYCPMAELTHHEGYSRGFTDNPAEPATFRKKYGNKIDPFYNPNLSLEHERFGIESRTVAPETLNPIRALMCAFNLNWEGAPQSQLEMTVRLKQMGVIEPIVYCPHEGPLREKYEANGIRVEVFEHPLAGVFDLPAYERAIERFARRITDWGVELVYGNTRQTFYAIEAAKHLNLPSLWNPREGEDWRTYFNYLGPGIAARALRCFNYPYKVIFVSNATREDCQPLNAHHNFITIHNGTSREKIAASLATRSRDEARAELGISRDEIGLLIVGTVCERKGQIDLVEAFSRLDEQAAGRTKCFIVGDRPGDYSDGLKLAVERLPASKRSRVIIVPETSDVALYYSAADIFVCTSRIESFPRVILEAMGAGLPIVTTPVYGIPEQVQENINALFYQPGNGAELAEKIERLVNDSRLRQRFADNSKYVLDMLITFEAMAGDYGRVFREAWLSGRSR